MVQLLPISEITDPASRYGSPVWGRPRERSSGARMVGEESVNVSKLIAYHANVMPSARNMSVDRFKRCARFSKTFFHVPAAFNGSHKVTIEEHAWPGVCFLEGANQEYHIAARVVDSPSGGQEVGFTAL